jgi:perosamine synthetase
VLARARSERNQGRGNDMAEIAHDRLGFNYRLSELAAAVGVAQLERADAILDARARVAAMYRERLAALDGLGLPCEDRPPERRSWFVYVVQLPEGVERDRVVSELSARAVQSKAYLPCIHLQPLYRERFGFAGGEFPIAESVSTRSLALPFYNTIGEDEVERVCEALREVLAQ